MKISARVAFYLKGNSETSDWISIGYKRTGEQEWDVLTEQGETIGRCWGPPHARMFSFGEKGHRSFHLQRLPTEKHYEVNDPWLEPSQKTLDNTVDFPVAPPDDEAQPKRTDEKTRERKRAHARLYESFEDSHRARKARKLRELAEKLEREAPK